MFQDIAFQLRVEGVFHKIQEQRRLRSLLSPGAVVEQKTTLEHFNSIVDGKPSPTMFQLARARAPVNAFALHSRSSREFVAVHCCLPSLSVGGSFLVNIRNCVELSRNYVKRSHYNLSTRSAPEHRHFEKNGDVLNSILNK